ncbi:unnamed protein product [Parascedosporium putredinis]|uniref:Uncharacterized protein n=1 Tax=Parascedosporium putredinis TaxID=1442378 RepID=A0A9P1MD00_9PEZI|nr:unnamed protein product [Parascedosporium putredinis]CAI8002587.1 unnamed protein product [Parascedosporium putredinis]
MAIAMGWKKPDNVAGTAAPAIMVGLFVASGGLLFGYDTGLEIVGLVKGYDYMVVLQLCRTRREIKKRSASAC